METSISAGNMRFLSRKTGMSRLLERLKGLIGPFILRRVKKDVLKELPDKLEKVVYSTLEEEQKKLYTANAILLKEKLESDDFKGAEKLQILSDLMQSAPDLL